MRKLKLDDETLRKVLADLEAHDARHGMMGGNRAADFFTYHIPGLRVDLDISRDETDSVIAPSRKLGPAGVYFLTSSLVHSDCPCRVHLVTVRNNWQTVSGKVRGCRYIPGTSGVHEVYVRFDHAVDPASFAAAATRSRILAADDSMVSQKLYARLLDTLNVELTCVSNGLEAVERALADSFDIVLMDLEMPEMDGLTAVRTLRSKGYFRTIVAVSAKSEPQDREQCLAAGCDDFLGKPLTRETLAAAIDRNRVEPLISELLDEPGMAELIDRFVKDMGETIARVERACCGGNLAELQREIRLLRGEAAGIGFGEITNAAVGVEAALKRHGDVTTIRPKLKELIRLCMAARPATSQIPVEPIK
jgi:CheY-like chemotaxis protein